MSDRLTRSVVHNAESGRDPAPADVRNLIAHIHNEAGEPTDADVSASSPVAVAPRQEQAEMMNPESPTVWRLITLTAAAAAILVVAGAVLWQGGTPPVDPPPDGIHATDNTDDDDDNGGPVLATFDGEQVQLVHARPDWVLDVPQRPGVGRMVIRREIKAGERQAQRMEDALAYPGWLIASGAFGNPNGEQIDLIRDHLRSTHTVIERALYLPQGESWSGVGPASIWELIEFPLAPLVDRVDAAHRDALLAAIADRADGLSAARSGPTARTQWILRQPDELTLLRVEPDPWREVGSSPDIGITPLEHGLAMLRKRDGNVIRTVPIPASRIEEVVVALTGSIHQSGEPAGCYNPRHVVMATRDGETCMCVLCFECFKACYLATDSPDLPGLAQLGDHAKHLFEELVAGADTPDDEVRTIPYEGEDWPVVSEWPEWTNGRAGSEHVGWRVLRHDIAPGEWPRAGRATSLADAEDMMVRRLAASLNNGVLDADMRERLPLIRSALAPVERALFLPPGVRSPDAGHAAFRVLYRLQLPKLRLVLDELDPEWTDRRLDRLRSARPAGVLVGRPSALTTWILAAPESLEVVAVDVDTVVTRVWRSVLDAGRRGSALIGVTTWLENGDGIIGRFPVAQPDHPDLLGTLIEASSDLSRIDVQTIDPLQTVIVATRAGERCYCLIAADGMATGIAYYLDRTQPSIGARAGMGAPMQRHIRELEQAAGITRPR